MKKTNKTKANITPQTNLAELDINKLTVLRTLKAYLTEIYKSYSVTHYQFIHNYSKNAETFARAMDAEIFIEDVIYGLGVAIDKDRYSNALGLRKFKQHLLDYLKDSLREEIFASLNKT